MNHSGIPQIHSNGEENSLSGEERLIKISLSPPLCQKPMIRKGNPDSTTGVLFASLVRSANEPSMEECFCTNFSPQNVSGEGGGTSHPVKEACHRKGLQQVSKQRSELFPAVEKTIVL